MKLKMFCISIYFLIPYSVALSLLKTFLLINVNKTGCGERSIIP